MDIVQGQRDVRKTFLGGFAGQLVSAVLWGTSAAACTWHSLRLGELILLFGGFLIFPATQLLLRTMGHAYALPKGHPMNALGIQVAFTLPLSLPLVIGIAAIRPLWFYPAFMILLGAHYLPLCLCTACGNLLVCAQSWLPAVLPSVCTFHNPSV